MISSLLNHREIGRVCRLVVRFLDVTVSRAMGCFFGCFRIRDDRARISHTTRPNKHTVSFILLRFLGFMLEIDGLDILYFCLFWSGSCDIEKSFVLSVFIWRWILLLLLFLFSFFFFFEYYLFVCFKIRVHLCLFLIEKEESWSNDIESQRLESPEIDKSLKDEVMIDLFVLSFDYVCGSRCAINEKDTFLLSMLIWDLNWPEFEISCIELEMYGLFTILALTSNTLLRVSEYNTEILLTWANVLSLFNAEVAESDTLAEVYQTDLEEIDYLQLISLLNRRLVSEVSMWFRFQNLQIINVF